MMYNNSGSALQGLGKFFATCLSGEDETGDLFPLAQPGAVLAADVARIKQHLLEKAVTMKGEDALRRYVQFHQYSLVSAMDQLFEQRGRLSTEGYYEALQGLLLFLKQTFPEYFNDDAIAPRGGVLAARADVAASVPSLENRLESSGADRAVIEMILDPLKRFLSASGEERVSFSRIQHLRYIVKHPVRLCESASRGQKLNRQLVQLLFYLNYNSQRSFLQLTTYVGNILKASHQVSDKIKCLAWLLKKVNQATVKSGTGYHRKSPTLKSQMALYIAEELRYWTNVSERENPPEVKTESKLPFKMKFNLSVAQLACLLRLFTGAGLITNRNTSALIRFVARNCETKRTGRISAGSLRIRYYEIEDGTQRSVRDTLAEVLKASETPL